MSKRKPKYWRDEYSKYLLSTSIRLHNVGSVRGSWYYLFLWAETRFTYFYIARWLFSLNSNPNATYIWYYLLMSAYAGELET